jgi:hypothetical protein
MAGCCEQDLEKEEYMTPCGSRKKALTKATRRNIPVDDILHSHQWKPQILHSINPLESVAEM